MRLYDLKYYVTSCECGSITKAAERLFVTQPTVTSAIRRLEKEYHIRLLEHTGKNMSLTQDGKQFFEEAKILLDQAAEFERHIAELTNEKRCVRLGLTRSVGTFVYADFFPSWMMFNHDIDVMTHSGSSSVLLEKLRGQQLDAIIIPSQEKDAMEDLGRISLLQMDMLYCMALSHPLAGHETVTVPEIVDEAMITTYNDENKTEALHRLFKQHGYDCYPKVVQRYDQLTMALSMIRQGAGTGYFPSVGCMGVSGIVCRKIEDDPAIYGQIAWTKKAWRREAVQTFVKELESFYRERGGAVRTGGRPLSGRGQ